MCIANLIGRWMLNALFIGYWTMISWIRISKPWYIPNTKHFNHSGNRNNTCTKEISSGLFRIIKICKNNAKFIHYGRLRWNDCIFRYSSGKHQFKIEIHVLLLSVDHEYASCMYKCTAVNHFGASDSEYIEYTIQCKFNANWIVFEYAVCLDFFPTAEY